MNKIIKFFFGKIIETQVQKAVKERIVEKVSAHDAMKSKAPLDVRVILASYEKDADLHDSFGISEKRKKVLHSALEKALKECDTFSQAVEQVSASCIHPNELGFCAYLIGLFAKSQQTMGGSMGLMGLISLLEAFKRKSKED